MPSPPKPWKTTKHKANEKNIPPPPPDYETANKLAYRPSTRRVEKIEVHSSPPPSSPSPPRRKPQPSIPRPLFPGEGERRNAITQSTMPPPSRERHSANNAEGGKRGKDTSWTQWAEKAFTDRPLQRKEHREVQRKIVETEEVRSDWEELKRSNTLRDAGKRTARREEGSIDREARKRLVKDFTDWTLGNGEGNRVAVEGDSCEGKGDKGDRSVDEEEKGDGKKEEKGDGKNEKDKPKGPRPQPLRPPRKKWWNPPRAL
ncbi:MAG: hypothetical protein Q9218_008084 [Villophora microphyllina]